MAQIIQLNQTDNTISLRTVGNAVSLLQVGRRGLQGIPGESSPAIEASKLDKTGGTITGNLVITGALTSNTLVVNSTARPAFLKTTSSVEHVLTSYLANPTAGALPYGGGLNNTAGNFISENFNNSTVFISGVEKNRGTLKVAHKGFSDGSDASAAAISIDLQTQYNASNAAIVGTGTAAQGIFITSTTDIGSAGIAGAPMTVRVTPGLDDFIIKGNGYLQLGATFNSAAQARLDIRQPTTGQAIFIQQTTGNTGDVLIAKDNGGTIRVRIDQNLNLVLQRSLYAVIGAQVGGTSTTFGNGSGILGITNATTVPTAAPTGGVAVYSEAGILKYRSSSGTIYTLANTGTNTGDQDLSSYATTSSVVAADALKVSKTGDTMTGSLVVANTATSVGLQITQTGNTSASSSVGGAINLNNTGNTGAGLVIYSNQAAPAGHLAVLRADNAAFNQSAMYVDYRGTSNAVSIINTGTGATNGVLNLTSSNTAETTLKISGNETGKGTIKVTHTGTGTDANAAGLSIDLAGTGTAAQGIFLDSTSGTTGKLLRLRNIGVDKFTVESTGAVTAAGAITATNLSGTNTGDQDLSLYATTTALNLKANLASPTFTGTVVLPSSQIVNGVTLSTAAGIGNFLRGDGTYGAPAGGGDMILASAQTNSGAKTYLDTTMQLRNVANTFNGSFVNTNTANRVYTLKDAAGTLAFTSDITGTNSGTNTGDQTTITGNAGTVTTNANLTGVVTSTGNATAIANGAITNSMLANGAVANLTGTNTGDQNLTPYALTTYVDGQAWNPEQTPADHGLKTYSYDPIAAVNTSTFTAGVLQIVRVKIPAATTISNLSFTVGTAGVAVTNGYIALYQGGTKLAQSADISSTLTSTGNKTAAITSTAVTAGYIQIVFWVGAATTVPAIARGAGTAGMNIGLTGTNLRYSTSGTAITTSSPATLGTQTTLNVAFWVGAS